MNDDGWRGAEGGEATRVGGCSAIRRGKDAHVIDRSQSPPPVLIFATGCFLFQVTSQVSAIIACLEQGPIGRARPENHADPESHDGSASPGATLDVEL
jgi:hypothetical protein